MSIEAWDQKWIEERDKEIKAMKKRGQIIDFLTFVGIVVISFLMGVVMGGEWW